MSFFFPSTLMFGRFFFPLLSWLELGILFLGFRCRPPGYFCCFGEILELGVLQRIPFDFGFLLL